jgi:hypothetical protein
MTANTVAHHFSPPCNLTLRCVYGIDVGGSETQVQCQLEEARRRYTSVGSSILDRPASGVDGEDKYAMEER